MSRSNWNCISCKMMIKYCFCVEFRKDQIPKIAAKRVLFTPLRMPQMTKAVNTFAACSKCTASKRLLNCTDVELTYLFCWCWWLRCWWQRRIELYHFWTGLTSSERPFLNRSVTAFAYGSALLAFRRTHIFRSHVTIFLIVYRTI